MELKQLHDTWEALARTDPLWAVLSLDQKKHGRWEPEEFFRTGREEIAAVLQRVDKLGLAVRRDSALDFGCGVGRLSRAMATCFDQVIGIDISESMIELARRHTPEKNVTFLLNQSDDLEIFPDHKFTFIYTGRVLQHIRPDVAKKYLREFIRILAPGGLAIAQVPSSVRGGSPEKSRLPDHAYQAAITVDRGPEKLPAGSSAELTVAVTNLSPVTWPTAEKLGIYQIRLGNHWLTRDGCMVRQDDGRTPLRQPLVPGRSREIKLLISAPAHPGEYLCELDLVQELVTWFAIRGSSTARLPIVVEAAPQAAAPPTAADGGPGDDAEGGIEMHTIPRQEVCDLIAEAGGEMVAVESDGFAGPEWESTTYYARKPRPGLRWWFRRHPILRRWSRLWIGRG